MKKTHDIRIITGKYKNIEGNEKARYLTIGNIFVNDQGYMKIKLDNPHPPIEGGWNGWANVYEVQEKDMRGNPRQPAPSGFNEDDIPF